MQSRSRWYAPDLGRFITPDPNGTGAPVMSTLAMLGTVPTGPPTGSFEWEAHFGDGFDVFGGYGGDPVNGTDPTGLFFSLGGINAANGIRMTLTESYGEGGSNALMGLDMLGAGIAAHQVMLAMMSDAAFGAAAGKAFEFALAGIKKVALAARSGFSKADDAAAVLRAPLGRGSSANPLNGSTLPRNLREQLAVQEAIGNAENGRKIVGDLHDPRWPGSEGWVKMNYVCKPGGESIHVHYVMNTRTGLIDDFKIKIRE